MSKYAEVIERLEKATGGDTELDARIWAALAGVKYVRHNKPYGDQLARTQVEYTEPPKRTRQVTNPPRTPHAEPVTSSIDAALAIVDRMLPGWWWLREDGVSIRLVGPDNNDYYPSSVGKHQIVPLAILLALFRALEAKEAG